MRNVMSIDLEDWFCVYNLSRVIPYADWDRCESRVERNTTRLLALFARHNVQATFFVLGWVADRFPDLVREVERAGHEIGTHGYAHRLLTFMTPEEFRADLMRSLEVLARTATQPVLGFRAPSFSLTAETLWAVRILQEAGLRYDSSVFPVGFHPDYGMVDADLEPHPLVEGLTELPMGVVEVLGRRVPCSGGGYFRLFPYELTRRLMRRCNAQGRSVMFYLHPWELDPDPPRIALPAGKAFAHYFRLSGWPDRLDEILGGAPFGTMSEMLASLPEPPLPS